MSLPVPLSWILTVAFACSCGWFLYQGARSVPAVSDRISLLAHAVMCVAMVAMVWPWGTRLPHAAQVAVLGASALWFLVLAVRARRTTLAIANAHHTLMAFVMIWMVAAPMPAHADAAPAHGGHAAMSGMTGMTDTAGPSTAALMFGVYFLVAAFVWLADAGTAAGPGRPLRRLSGAAGHAAMSAGAGVLTLAMA